MINADWRLGLERDSRPAGLLPTTETFDVKNPAHMAAARDIAAAIAPLSELPWEERARA